MIISDAVMIHHNLHDDCNDHQNGHHDSHQNYHDDDDYIDDQHDDDDNNIEQVLILRLLAMLTAKPTPLSVQDVEDRVSSRHRGSVHFFDVKDRAIFGAK